MTILPATPVVLTYNLGPGLLAVLLVGVSKAGGAFAAPSLGAIAPLGAGWYGVTLDAIDTNTAGALALNFGAGVGVPVDPPAEWVGGDLVGDLLNDGTATLRLKAVIVDNAAAGVGVTIKGTKAIECTGNTGDAVEIQSVAGAGFRGLYIAGEQGVMIEGNLEGGIEIQTQQANGVLITSLASPDPAVHVHGAMQGVFFESDNSIGFNMEGATIGMAAFALGVGMSIGGPELGLLISTTNDSAMVIQSTNAVALNVTGGTAGMKVEGQANEGVEVIGATDGATFSGTAGPAIALDGVSLPLACTEQLLNLVNGVELNRTVKDSLRLILAAAAGKSSLAANTRIYRDTNDTVDRITALVNAFGERLTVTYIT